MAINEILFPTVPNPVSGDWAKAIALVENAYKNINIPVQVVSGNIPQGAVFQVGGHVYEANSDTSISGVASDYVKLTVSGTTLVPSYISSLAGVTWNKVYNGYYDVSDNLYLFDEFKAYSVGLVSNLLTKERNLNGVPYASELNDQGIEIVSGTLRQDATIRTNWNWIKDANHEPIGVDDSTPAIASSSSLTIPFLKTYTKALTFVCSADETLANALNFLPGASLGLSSAIIKASIDLTLAAHIYYDGASWQKVYGPGQGGAGAHNVNITNIAIAVGGLITIDHSWITGIDVTLTGKTNGTIPLIPIIDTITDTAITLYFVDYTGAVVTSPTTAMSLTMTKNFAEGIRLDGVDNGATLDLDAGNMWFFGLMQK